MRKIEQEMCQACKLQKDWRLDNTIVEREERKNGVYMRIALCGSEIAMVDYEHAVVMVRHCGYMTNTTKSRLNALLRFFCGVTISCKNREWTLNGEAVEAQKFTDVEFSGEPFECKDCGYKFGAKFGRKCPQCLSKKIITSWG